MSLSSNFPTVMPGLNLDFINATSLDPRITFTRSLDTATYFDSSGILRTALANTPRLDYDPVTLAPRGLLIEEARTNRIANTVVNGAMSIGTGSAIGPNGNPMSTAIIGSGAVSFPQLGVGSGNAQSLTLTAGQSVDVALSGWFAAGTSGMIIEPRLIADFRTAPNTNFTYAELQINTSTWTVRSKSLGVDITEVSAPSITLFRTGVYRVTWVVRYTQGATIRDTSSVYIQLRDSTGSGTFTGDGVGNFQYFGVQGETGSFPTSYIPTTTTALTRNADVASVNTLAPWYNSASGSWYVETISPPYFGAGYYPTSVQFTDGTSNNTMATLFNTNGAPRAERTASGVTAGSLNTSPVATVNTLTKQAFTYALNDFALVANGGTPATSAAGNVPTGLTQMTIGALFTSNKHNSYIRRITYYPYRLTNSQLQALTQS